MMLDALLAIGCLILVLELLGLIEIVFALRRGALPRPAGVPYLLGLIAFAWTVPLRRLNVLTWWLFNVKILKRIQPFKRDDHGD